MADYIDREELLTHQYNASHSNLPQLAEMVVGVEDIEDAPAADVAPVVHGSWEGSTDDWFGTDVYTCTKCRESYVLVEGTPKQNLWHYCPNCGAKMDGGAGNAAD